MTGPVGGLAGLVRRHDRDRYQTALFAPADRREALFALYAFNYEIARVRETVTQPMLGQIRLQWWREIVDAAFEGRPPRPHEVAEPLAAVIRDVVPTRAHFDRMIDIRERDLADQPPATLAALEDYAEGTAATLLYLALEVLGVAEPAAGAAAREVGIGYALAGLLRALPFHARTARCYIPADIAARIGLDPADYAEQRDSAGVRAASAEIAAAAAGHLQAALRYRREVPRAARAAMLGAVVADRFLFRLKRAGFNPFAAELAMPDPLQSWCLAAAAIRRRF
ncbi:MAG TPA: squalene/phytoene synthase family protein [Stellaceae bacterium]|nr:squalene/phytoene synthase family protein [Stellaceae bacterium]